MLGVDVEEKKGGSAELSSYISSLRTLWKKKGKKKEKVKSTETYSITVTDIEEDHCIFYETKPRG